jgi:putative hemolysin
MTPLSFIIKVVNDVFCKLLNLPISHKEDVVTEEGILMMVEAGNETGVLEESQKEMINNIFEFGDVTVSEVMTHRTNIVAIDINSKIADVVYLAVNEGFSRIPVYENTIDTIIGIIYVKDLLCLIGCDCSENFSLKDFIRDVIYIPDTSKCDALFEHLTKKKMQMAIVVDEYGGTSGIITMEDLLEEIVGNIQDEYDEDEVDIVEVDKNIFTIKGSADPEEIFEKLNINLPSHQDYNTMSAFIVDLIGRIPAEDEAPSVNYENVEFTVLLMEDNWVSKIKAVIKS